MGGPAHQLFAPVPLGLERVLAEEIRALGASHVRQVRAGVSFTGPLETAYRVCLWSRVASRVLLRLGEVPASDTDALYEGVAALPWEDHVPPDGTLAIDVTASRSPITHTGFATLRVKDAVVDRLRERFGVRPDIDTVSPDVRLNVALRGERATLALDLGGEGLHRRGYRAPGEQAAAPLKETLAAGVLLLAGWPSIRAREGAAFVDPMCGSGTLVLEAALMACDIAPGLLRERWGFSAWRGHDADAWAALLAEAGERRSEGLARGGLFVGGDVDRRAVGLAKASAGRAGVSRVVRFEVADVAAVAPPRGGAGGLVAVNPPYGERLGGAELRDLYAALGETLRARFGGWRACVVTGAEDLIGALGLVPAAEHETFNGRIPVRVFVSDIPAPAADGTGAAVSSGVAPAGSGAEMFANRLRKNARHLGKWARRTGVTCYRVYDADLPEYAVAIDLYAGAGPDEGRLAAHVAEYAPPASVDPALARRRLREAVAVTADVLGIAPADVHLKVRRRQKGSAQYTRQGRERDVMTVAEGGLLFEVNLSDYLDTGLFLDHRLTRGMVRDAADGARFLNLFAYTGTASVYAAAGGARATTTVDLSATYLDWAERNMLMNGITGGHHTRVRADALEWLATAARGGVRPFDLVFCDPPTFSNSKRMEGTFDVQRDHPALIAAIEPLLAPDGTLLFSNNRRRFDLDTASLEALGLASEDLTAASIPPDFERNPRVHTLWRITRRGGGS